MKHKTLLNAILLLSAIVLAVLCVMSVFGK